MSDGRVTLFCLADMLGRQAAILRGETYDSKLERWLDQTLGRRFPNPCTPSALPGATCRKGEP